MFTINITWNEVSKHSENIVQQMRKHFFSSSKGDSRSVWLDYENGLFVSEKYWRFIDFRFHLYIMFKGVPTMHSQSYWKQKIFDVSH